MMKYLLLSIITIFTFTGAFAGSALCEDVEPKQKSTTVTKKLPTQPQNEKVPEKAQWPIPFTPSETIPADAIISFPTDI